MAIKKAIESRLRRAMKTLYKQIEDTAQRQTDAAVREFLVPLVKEFASKLNKPFVFDECNGEVFLFCDRYSERNRYNYLWNECQEAALDCKSFLGRHNWSRRARAMR